MSRYFLIALLMTACSMSVKAGEAELEWTYQRDTDFLTVFGALLDYDSSAVPVAGPRQGGVLVARHDLDGDGHDEWIVVPDHLCSASACDVAILVGDPPTQALYQVTSFGLPALGQHDADGRWTLVFQAIGDGPTCCAPRLPIEHGINIEGNWVERGPVQGKWPVRWYQKEPAPH